MRRERTLMPASCPMIGVDLRQTRCAIKQSNMAASRGIFQGLFLGILKFKGSHACVQTPRFTPRYAKIAPPPPGGGIAASSLDCSLGHSYPAPPHYSWMKKHQWYNLLDHAVGGSCDLGVSTPTLVPNSKLWQRVWLVEKHQPCRQYSA